MRGTAGFECYRDRSIKDRYDGEGELFCKKSELEREQIVLNNTIDKEKEKGMKVKCIRVISKAYSAKRC